MIRCSSVLQDAVSCLRTGGLLAYPTEGVYGLGCDARRQAVCGRIVALKQRDPGQGLICLVHDWTVIADWIEPLNSLHREMLARYSEDTVTWLVAATKHAPRWLTGQHSSLAIRVPKWPATQLLCASFNGPIVSTSANPHGLPAAHDAVTVRQYFDEGIELIWDQACGDHGRPSDIRVLNTGEKLR